MELLWNIRRYARCAILLILENLTNWDTAILKLGQRAFLNLNDSTDVGEPLDDHAR